MKLLKPNRVSQPFFLKHAGIRSQAAGSKFQALYYYCRWEHMLKLHSVITSVHLSMNLMPLLCQMFVVGGIFNQDNRF